MTSYQKLVTSLSSSRFLANLEQIPDTESAKVMFSGIVTFCLRKNSSRAKKSLTQSLKRFLNLSPFWTKNINFLQKHTGISKVKGTEALNAIFSETIYECVLTCQI